MPTNGRALEMFFACDGMVAERNRVCRPWPQGGQTWLRPYFGPPPARGLGVDVPLEYVPPASGEAREPQAYMVEQEREVTVPAHFHYVDQFQVVVGGSGLIGRHEVGPFSVHFSLARTGYGPIVPGPEGIDYLTLRASPDSTGAHYLPGARDKIGRGKKRNVIVDEIAAQTLTDQGPGLITYVAEPDGLAIAVLRLQAGGQGMTALEYSGGGQFVVVLDGQVSCQTQAYGPLSVLFASAGKGPLALDALGPASVLVLQYPNSPPPASLPP